MKSFLFVAMVAATVAALLTPASAFVQNTNLALAKVVSTRHSERVQPLMDVKVCFK